MLKNADRVTKRYYLIGVLAIIVFMLVGVGYSVLTEQLNIQGTANITSNWNILFTDVQEMKMTNATTISKEIKDGTTLTLNTELTKPGASAVYQVTVENQGTLDAVVSSIGGVTETNEKQPQSIKVAVSEIEVGDELLVDGTKTFQVTVQWDPEVDFNETNMSKEIEITVNYKQQ